MFQLGFDGERLSIPYLTPTGVVAIKYRCIDYSHGEHKGIPCPKYTSESGCGIHLYNARALIGAVDTVVVCEGELDALCVQAYAGIPAVAYPGTESWKAQKHWRLCFEAVSEVVVIADGDVTGKESAKRVADSIGYTARVVEMPSDAKDANTFIHQRGVQEFIQRIQ